MNPTQINPGKLKPGREADRILQRADLVWSKMTIEPGEVLLVKVSKHLEPHIQDIKNIIDGVFKHEGDRVLLYVDGDISFEKVHLK